MRKYFTFASQQLFNLDKFLRRPVVSGTFYVVMLLLIGISSITYNLGQTNSDNCEINPTQYRSILGSTFIIKGLWAVDLKIDRRINDNNYLVSTADQLFAGKYCPEEVINFDLKTGQIIWRSEKISSIDSLTLDTVNSRVYVSAQEEIRALSISTGETLWRNNDSSFIRTSHPIQIAPDGKVLVYPRTASISYVNPLSGELDKLDSLPRNTFLFFNDIAFTLDGNIVQAMDPKTDKVLWTQVIGDSSVLSMSGLSPYVKDNLLLLRWGGIQSHVTAFDWKTGKVIWQVKDHTIISNVVIADGIAYALDSQARLLLIDVHTGTEIGMVQFDMPKNQSDLLYYPGQIGGSWIAVVNDTVSVYFQDTNMLCVYKIEPTF